MSTSICSIWKKRSHSLNSLCACFGMSFSSIFEEDLIYLIRINSIASLACFIRLNLPIWWIQGSETWGQVTSRLVLLNSHANRRVWVKYARTKPFHGITMESASFALTPTSISPLAHKIEVKKKNKNKNASCIGNYNICSTILCTLYYILNEWWQSAARMGWMEADVRLSARVRTVTNSAQFHVINIHNIHECCCCCWWCTG